MFSYCGKKSLVCCHFDISSFIPGCFSTYSYVLCLVMETHFKLFECEIICSYFYLRINVRIAQVSFQEIPWIVYYLLVVEVLFPV